MNETHVAEVRRQRRKRAGQRSISSRPVDEEGFAEQEPSGNASFLHLQILRGQIDSRFPEAGIAADRGIVAKDKILVRSEPPDGVVVLEDRLTGSGHELVAVVDIAPET